MLVGESICSRPDAVSLNAGNGYKRNHIMWNNISDYPELHPIEKYWAHMRKKFLKQKKSVHFMSDLTNMTLRSCCYPSFC